MRKKKNGFTLIELLAIIVILAIIAVITVPIILNIIENSRVGAAQDSAYGYRDAVEKYYVSELFDNKNLILDGDYTVENGKLKGDSLPTIGVEIPADGTIPTSGFLTYENSIFKSGCIVIGDYAVTFNPDKTTSIEKGECSQAILSVPTISSCPGCKFIYTTNEYAIEGSVVANDYSTDMPSGVTDDYTTLIGAGGHQFFLGLIESTTMPGKIGRAFACGIEGDIPFCFEGGINESSLSEKPVYASNIGIANSVFSCDASVSDSANFCYGLNVNGFVYSSGSVYVYGKTGGDCTVDFDGNFYCYG